MTARLAGAALAAAALAALAAAWVAGSWLSAPVPAEAGPPPPELGARDVRIPGDGGVELAAWFAPAAAGAPTVVLSHGVRGSRRQLLGRALFLARAGYGVLLYDARAHGESSGDRMSFGWLEARDAAAVVAFVREGRPAAPIGFIGPSLAGAAALLGPEPLDVSALVLEAVYPELVSAVENRIALRLGRTVAPLATRLLLLPAAPRLGFDPHALNPVETIAGARAPILLIAGGADRRTTLGESRALFAAAPEPKELWVLPNARHENFHAHAPAAYEARVLAFFARHLGRP